MTNVSFCFGTLYRPILPLPFILLLFPIFSTHAQQTNDLAKDSVNNVVFEKGATTIINLRNVSDTRIISAPEALQGKVAGITITPNTGEPGSGMTFNIRGVTSFQSNRPLVVIDGQPVLSESTVYTDADITPLEALMSALNPDDIESIEILKDAFSAGTYGARAANGAILITTKSGKRQTNKLSYSSRIDMSILPEKIEMLNSRDYMLYINEGRTNSGFEPSFTEAQITSLSPVNVNWQELLYRKAVSHDHKFSVSNSNHNSNYFISGNFSDHNSIVSNSGLKSTGFRVNYDKIVSKKLSVGFRSYLSHVKRDYVPQSNGLTGLSSSVVLGALAYNPLTVNGEPDDSFMGNPVLISSNEEDKTKNRTLISNLTARYLITKDLNYIMQGGINKINALRSGYIPNDLTPDFAPYRSDFRHSNYFINNRISYGKKVSQHSVIASAGLAYQRWKADSESSPSGRNLSASSARALTSLSTSFNYAYDDKYHLGLISTYESSSSLAPTNKWAFFPSVNFGWIVSNENFFKDKGNHISLLKLHASYGIAGNDNLAPETNALYSTTYFPNGQNIDPSHPIADIKNMALKWEKTKQFNFGADFGFLKDRITISADIYHKKTSDLIVALTLPSSSGAANYINIGEVINEGVDIAGTFRILNGAVTFDAGANFSVFDNMVNDLGVRYAAFHSSDSYITAGGGLLLGQPVHVATAGQPISSFLGYKTAGIYQNAAEVAAGPEASTAQPGDVRWVDNNADGKITQADRVVIGNADADFTYGFNSSISFKRFSFNVTLFGSHGNQLVNLNKWVISSNNVFGNFNSTREAYDGRWTGEGTSTLYPRLTASSKRLNHRLPDWMVENASFLRLQNLSLAYTIPLPSKLKAKTLRTFVSGTNILTITDYSGYDPNINAFNHNSLSSGLDLGTIPQPRTYSVGIGLSF